MKKARRITIALTALLLGVTACGAVLSACGEERGQTEPEHTHTVSEWTVVLKPDCTSAGRREGECTVCHETVSEVLPPQHDWGRTTQLISTADCTHPGKYMAECKKCKTIGEVETPALGHSWQSVEVLEEPTCTKAGKRSVQCSRCGDTKELEIAMLEHEWESFFTVDVEANFDRAGSRSVHCRNCDAKKDETVIPRLEANTPILYQLNLVRNNGNSLNVAGVGYEVYNGTEKVKEGTFSRGVAAVSLLPKTYTIELTNLPAGYTAAQSYTVQPTSPVCNLNVTGSVVEGEMPSNYHYSTGSSMYDFTLTSTGNRTLKLSELLRTKKMVMLNFWYVGCVWCRTEFPGMEKAYKQYQDDIEIIAIDSPTADGRDSLADTTSFANSYGLTFPIVHGEQGDALVNAFGVTAFPTTVIIDSEGVVSEIHESALVEDTDGDGEYDDSTRLFESLFKKYTEAPYYRAETAAVAYPVRKKD